VHSPLKVRLVLYDPAWQDTVRTQLIRLPSYLLHRLIDQAAECGGLPMSRTEAKRWTAHTARCVSVAAGQPLSDEPSIGFNRLADALLHVLKPEQFIAVMLELQYTPAYLQVVDVICPT
jgi:hypothetical protein